MKFETFHEKRKPLGSITTSEDQCIVFPNTLLHAVSDFKSQDDTKNGYRKQLVFFLINPSTPILSTSTVPPQQPEWLIEAMTTYRCFGRSFAYDDIIPLIVSFMTPFYDKRVVRAYRNKLVKQRKHVNEKKEREQTAYDNGYPQYRRNMNFSMGFGSSKFDFTD